MKISAWPKSFALTGNPYFEAIYESLERQGASVKQHSWKQFFLTRYDVWHIHLPDRAAIGKTALEAFARATVFALATGLAKLRGTRIVWTVHNLRPHERNARRLQTLVFRFLARLADLSIHLSEAGREQAFAAYPALTRKPNAVVRHPHYRRWYPDTVTRAQARAHLGLPDDAKVALFLGQIRPYKNVPALIDTFRRIPNPSYRLVVAGQPKSANGRGNAADGIAGAIGRAADGDPRIAVHLGFVPDEKVQTFMRAADLVVCPYADILNSGAALLGLSFGVPTVLLDRGAMPELQRLVGQRWVRLFDDPLSPDALEKAIEWGAASLAENLEVGPDLSSLDPDLVADQHRDLLMALVHHVARPLVEEHGASAVPAPSNNTGRAR